MTERPEIEMMELTPTPAVVISRSTEAARLGESVKAGIQRVKASVTAARVPTAGAPFVRYLSTGERFDLEIGIPVAGSHSVPGLRATILPGGRAATLEHTGRHDTLREALGRLEQWVSAHGRSAGAPWEWYLTEHDAHPARTQLVWPVGSP